MTELLPSFMSDIIANSPDEQKVRTLERLISIIVPLDTYKMSVTVQCLVYKSKTKFLSSYCML